MVCVSQGSERKSNKKEAALKQLPLFVIYKVDGEEYFKTRYQV